MGNKGFRFTWNWKITLFSIVLIPLLCSLGVWQLHRATEKQNIQQLFAQQQALPVLPITKLTQQQSFRRVSVQGVFDQTQYWLLENQILDGRLGSNIVMPFITDYGVILVNRGWVKGGEYRSDIATFSTPSSAVSISGTLVTPTNSVVINQRHIRTQKWPQNILEVDVAWMSENYGTGLFSQILNIDPDSQGALDVQWRPINMSSSKHTGYAVQWFCMAIAAAVLCLFANSNLAQIIRKDSE